MQFSVGVEYALHCLLYLVKNTKGENIGVKELAKYQGVSETYLSKIFTKLKKAGIIKSLSGVKGGYELLKPSGEISFWDVVEAIEGSSYLFQCNEVRQREIILDINNLPDSYKKSPCLIKTVMEDAEELMRESLRSKTLQWLHEQVEKKVPEEHQKKTQEWFENEKLKKGLQL